MGSFLVFVLLQIVRRCWWRGGIDGGGGRSNGVVIVGVGVCGHLVGGGGGGGGDDCSCRLVVMATWVVVPAVAVMIGLEIFWLVLVV